MPVILMMAQSKSSSVLYECAITIGQLTTAPSAINLSHFVIKLQSNRLYHCLLTKMNLMLKSLF
jgi:hypothetical protein